MTQSPDESKVYATDNQGLAAFIRCVNCGEDTFVRVDIAPQGRPVLTFRDDVRVNPCGELETLYHEGAQLRDVKRVRPVLSPRHQCDSRRVQES